ncbi:MAG TPA: flagellar biosynthesis protein FliQ [Limnochordales bacterium]
MTDATVVDLGREALLTVLLVAGPMLGLGLLVGLVVSILQATTQIQEQTLTFIPKILAVLGAAILFGPWMLRVMTEYAARLLGNLHRFAG